MSDSKGAPIEPTIEGYRVIRWLGGGGFADVYLCADKLGRTVAVKVLHLSKLSVEDRAKFDSEAKAMGLLANHPAIVTIYDAGLGSDGRPYLAMEYCPTSLANESRARRFTVPEVLDLGVEISGAVQAAHSLGILHRDIKPANVLVTSYGQAALSDFGISARLDEAGQVEGFSVMWAPPEAFVEAPRPDVRSDVWSLAATLYTLLAGRAPFQIPGRVLPNNDMIDRIERLGLPAIGREDVPSSLEQVLREAMAKDPRERTASATHLGRALQRIQSELLLPPTRWFAEVVERPGPTVADDEPGTKLRSITAISPLAPTQPREPTIDKAPEKKATPAAAKSATPTRPPATPTGPRYDRARPLSPDDDQWNAPVAEPAPAESDTVIPVLAPEPEPAPARRRTPRKVLGLALAAVIVVGALVGVWLVASRAGERVSTLPVHEDTSKPQDIVAPKAPMPQDLSGRKNGTQVTFTWTNPKPAEGDVFMWRTISATGPLSEFEDTSKTTVSVKAVTPQTCLEVLLRRSDATSSKSAKACTPS